MTETGEVEEVEEAGVGSVTTAEAELDVSANEEAEAVEPAASDTASVRSITVGAASEEPGSDLTGVCATELKVDGASVGAAAASGSAERAGVGSDSLIGVACAMSTLWRRSRGADTTKTWNEAR